MHHYNSIEDVDMFVLASIREDERIDICTEDAEVILTCSHLQWHHILKGVKINGDIVFRFKRQSSGEYVYPICSTNLERIKDIIKQQNEED